MFTEGNNNNIVVCLVQLTVQSKLIWAEGVTLMGEELQHISFLHIDTRSNASVEVLHGDCVWISVDNKPLLCIHGEEVFANNVAYDDVHWRRRQDLMR